MRGIVTIVITVAAAVTEPPNQRDRLLPAHAHGAWRGTTIMDSDLFDGLPIHVYRGFKRHSSKFDELERDFIDSGGIYFYSLQPRNWTKASSGQENSMIDGYVEAIKGVAPAKVMVAVGFEPDVHASDLATNKDVYGTVAEYRAMYSYYVDYFNDRNVSNVVWIMDYSAESRLKSSTLVKALWPGNYVQWLFFNLFQSKNQEEDGGNCTDMLDQLYERFSDYSHLPWGLGAWGTKNQTFQGTAIPTKDRVRCLKQVQTAFASNKYPNLRASVYFNSQKSQLSVNDDPALVEAFQTFQKSWRFSINDDKTKFVSIV